MQTWGDMLDWHPYVHAIVTRGGWDAEVRLVPMPSVSTAAAEKLFRHKVIAMLRDEVEGAEEVAADPEVTEPGAAERRRLRRSWAQLIRRIYEVDPLTCTECGGEMRIIAFLLEPAVVRKILDHLAKRPGRSRGPPGSHGALTAMSR